MLSIYARRRIAVAAMIFGMAIAAWITVYAMVVVSTPPSDYPDTLPVTIVTVTSGDTWWDLAATCPDMDRRVAVDRLAAIAGLDPDDTLYAGQLALVCTDDSDAG